MPIHSNRIPRGSQHSKIECLANFLLQTRVSPHLPSKQTRAVTYTTIEMSRFATTSDAELLRVIENGHAKNTRKANERAASLLKCYLKEKNMPVNFAHFSKKELNDVLAQFYINVRQVNGEKYKVSSLENLRHGLNRFFEEPPSREGLRHHTRCRISRSERELSSSFKAVENRRKRCCRSTPC